MFNKVFIVVFVTLVCSIFITYITVPTMTLLSWVNTLFLMSLLLLIIGCVLIIWQGGFLNGLIWSFKHFLYNVDKSKQFIKQVEGKEDRESLPYKMNKLFTKVIIASGVTLVAISLMISIWLTL